MLIVISHKLSMKNKNNYNYLLYTVLNINKCDLLQY